MLLFRAGNADKAPLLSAAIRTKKKKKKIRLAQERSSSKPQVPVSASDQASAFFIQAVKLKHKNVKEIRNKEPKY